MLKLTLFLFAAALLSVNVAADDKKAPPGEKPAAPKLEGTYTIESGEKAGAEIPADRIKGAVVIFTADSIVGTDKDKKEFFSSTYTLDASKKPYAITMKDKGKNADPAKPAPAAAAEVKGLVEVEGDNVKIIYALPGGDAPTAFKTKEKQHLFVLKKVKTDK